jgi:hypothetical protein
MRITKNPPSFRKEDFLIFTKKSLFFFVGSFNATGADSGFCAINLLALQVDLEFSQGFDIGMTHSVARAGTAAANFTYSTHKIRY